MRIQLLQIAMQAHTQARVWWACLLSYLLSPALGLLSLFGCYWVLCQDPVKWLLWVRIARPVWRCGAVIVGWFQFGWATIPIVGVLSKSHAVLLAAGRECLTACIVA